MVILSIVWPLTATFAMSAYLARPLMNEDSKIATPSTVLPEAPSSAAANQPLMHEVDGSPSDTQSQSAMHAASASCTPDATACIQASAAYSQREHCQQNHR